MLRRATHLLDRARARIRAAADHDPHAWQEHAVLVLEDGSRAHVERVEDDDQPEDDGPPDPAATVHPGPRTADEGTAGHPLGSPHPDAPDPDANSNADGVSGPPGGGRPHRPIERRRSLLAPDRPQPSSESQVPNGLRMAAAWSWRVIVVIAGIYVLLYAAAYLAVVVVPVIVALLLAAMLQPGAAFLVRHGWPRSLAAVAMLVVGLGVVAGIITLVVDRFSAGFTDLADQVSQGLVRIQQFAVATFPISQGQIDQTVANAQDALLANRETLTAGALTTAATVGEVFAGLVLALFTLFFFLLDGRAIWLWLVGLFPRDSRAYVDEAARRAWRTLISYVRATIIVALIDAIGIGIALAVLSVPLVIPLAALVFLGAFIPIIGSFLAGTVAVLVALVSNGPVTALIALAAVIGIMQLEGHVLQPLLLGRAVRVHPLAVVLAIAAGLLIAGIFGALISVPLMACTNVAGSYLARRLDGPRPPEPRLERAASTVTVG